jgi:hypothetical protein
MRAKLAVLVSAVLLISSAGVAQEIDLNINLNIPGLSGGDDNSSQQQQAPQQSQETDQQQQQEPAIDRDHDGRETGSDPITSEESEEDQGVMGSVSGFISSLLG